MGLFGFFKKEKEPVVVAQQRDNSDVVPIKQRIKGKQPSCDGLYPHEVLVLSYADKYCESGNDFPGFWWYKYGIKDVQSILKSLESRGYIEKGGIEAAINLEKLATIKDILQKNGLKSSGKKAELISRLVEGVPESVLATAFPRVPYVFTPSGEQILKKYEWIPFIHSHAIEDLDIWNLTERVQTPPYTKYRDKIWSYLNERSIAHAKARDFGLYRNARFEMSEFVATEGKDDLAFKLLCEVIAYDLSGLSNNFNPQYLYMQTKFFFPYESSIITVAPGIISRVTKFQEKLGWDEKELRSNLLAGVSIPIPYRVFTPEECVEVVVAEIKQDKAKLSKLYSSAEKRFKKEHPAR